MSTSNTSNTPILSAVQSGQRDTNSCTQMRRKLVTHSTLSLRTGERSNERQEWVTEPCGAPLFGNDRARGMCRSCANGWTHPNNYPVTP